MLLHMFNYQVQQLAASPCVQGGGCALSGRRRPTICILLLLLLLLIIIMIIMIILIIINILIINIMIHVVITSKLIVYHVRSARPGNAGGQG